MKHIQFLVLLFLFSGMSLFSYAQHYKIAVDIENLGDSTVYLGYYYGDKQFAKDTITLDKNGKGAFTGNDTLSRGVYFVLVPGNMFFEIVIDEDQDFSVSSKYNGNAGDLTKHLKSKGSSEMDLYLDYQQFMSKQSNLAISLRDRLKSEKDEVKKKVLTDSLNILHEQVKAKWTTIESKHPSSIIASILLCNKEIEIPEPPKDDNGVIIDSMFQYKYYKAHYFDYVNFTDQRLLFTQFYHPKIERYFEKLIIPAPDTVIKESKMILDKVKDNEEMFKYTLQFLFNKYNNSNIMGMDKAFVFFAENYYLNGVAHWADSTWLKKVEDRVREIKPNLIGNKAPEIKLLAFDDSFVSLHLVQAEYTVLFFYEPTCGHCKKTTPKMKALYEKYWEKGVEVIAIYTQVDKEEWSKFIKDQKLEEWINAWDPYHQSNFRYYYDVRSTPSIYLLDKDKNIIGKRIDVETLEKILEDKLGK
ncbi:MAG: redoxin domain-containing protein [Salinivirgaceae bacterium]|nr:redoxin domain-containing protein [Salinivirgaceae bacterium]